mgnify:CR=1 FL=1
MAIIPWVNISLFLIVSCNLRLFLALFLRDLLFLVRNSNNFENVSKLYHWLYTSNLTDFAFCSRKKTPVWMAKMRCKLPNIIKMSFRRWFLKCKNNNFSKKYFLSVRGKLLWEIFVFLRKRWNFQIFFWSNPGPIMATISWLYWGVTLFCFFVNALRIEWKLNNLSWK